MINIKHSITNHYINKFINKIFLFFSFVILLNSCSSNLSDVSDINYLMQNGYKYHEEGDFKKAIKHYKRVLEIDEMHSLANYEIAYSYSAIGDKTNAIKHSKNVIDIGKEGVEQAYILYASMLDDDNQPITAIEAFKKGISKFPRSFALYYNLAITQFRLLKFKDAEETLISALKLNPNHPRASLLLADINMNLKQKAKAILSLYYHLLIYPKEENSSMVLKQLKEYQNHGIKNKGNSTDILLFSNEDSDPSWSAAEMMLSLSGAMKFEKAEIKKTEMESFVDVNKSFLGILTELKKENKDFYWDFYVTKVEEMKNMESLETFSYYISQSTNNKEVNDWIKNNLDKFDKLDLWVRDKLKD